MALPQSESKTVQANESPPKRSFVWSHYPECGFPVRVNHCTVIARNGSDGRDYVYSFGGFYEGEEEREKRLKSNLKPFFKTGPIDIYCMDIGELERWNRVL